MRGPLASLSHRARWCHGLTAFLGIAVAGAGCGGLGGFHRSESRACGSPPPTRVCLEARPDRGLQVAVGGLLLLPGECMAGERGGWLRLELSEGRGRVWRRSVHARGGHTTFVEIDARGRTRVRVRRCEARGP